ncbi:unnamed protein product [Dibothriocephalus latus]|uniref:SCP domain-containing protein n=1 Tax=Dibothriocephalus latus TaxID=60516 RepID=A0A3P6U6L3_DIBLA|nr:unnamed protein product [Dibothriocephalus latus]
MSRETKEVNRQALETHNWQRTLGIENEKQLRALHGAPPLKYSKRLALNAQSYAEHLAKYDLFDHSDGGNYGENLIVRKGPGSTQLTGHFTQLVWRDTEKVGFGVARSKDNKAIYIVAHYFPSGNYKKEYKKNVLPPERGRLYIPTNRDLSKLKAF